MNKKIKNILISVVLGICLIMVLSLSACSKGENISKGKSLYAQGLEVIQVMSEMTQEEEYVELHTGNSEIKTIIQNISTGDYSSPKAVYAISISDENLAAMAEVSNLDSASEELKDFLLQRVLGSLMTQINGMSGVENLAASSVCTVSKIFVNENVADDVIYLYTYDDAVPVAVTFTVGEDQAVSANGVFVMYDQFTCGSSDEIKEFFSDISVDVAEVQPEK